MAEEKDFDNPWDSLTEKQKHRLKLYMAGCSVTQIAESEKVARQNIWKSLSSCFKKIPSLKSMVYDWRRPKKG